MKEEHEKESHGLPNAKIGQIVDLVEKMSVLGEASDREGLAYALGIETKSLSNPLRACELLGLLTLDGDNITLSQVGKEFEHSDEEQRKKLFGIQLSKSEPFSTIVRALKKETEMESSSVLKLVKAKIVPARKWKESTDKEMMRMIVNWAEYGKILSYDSKSRKVRYVGDANK
jgi:NitT/TauT family transport system ATP-binding protein